MEKILVIDDDDIIREVTVRILSMSGHEVDQTGSLTLARERLIQNDYAVVVTEAGLADLPGALAVRTIKEIRPRADVIVLTDHGTLEQVIESMRAGVSDILIKPCSSQELKDTVQKTLTKRALSRENHLLRALNQMKDKFLNLVSHELRTPLTLVHGYLSIFRKRMEAFDPSTRDLLAVIVRSTQKLIQIVNNIQTITQCEAGEIKLHLRPLNLHRLLSDTVAEMQSATVERKLSIKMEPVTCEDILCADSIRLRQTVTELLQNAIRNTPDGGEISVGLKRGDRHLTFWVKDTGIGITQEEQSRIFEPFYEVADIENHSSGDIRFQCGGMGLGLSLVKAVVEAHQGHIHLTSEPGRGTRFEIQIPADLPAIPDDEEEMPLPNLQPPAA